MNAPTDIQVINGPDGKPAFVVGPYADVVELYGKDRDLIPNEAGMGMAIMKTACPGCCAHSAANLSW